MTFDTQPEPFDPLPLVIKITVAVMFLCLIFMLATGGQK
jgi:hypothetical protein